MVPALRERQEAAGAQYGRIGGIEVVRHYGDARAEYAAVREGAGVAIRGDRTQLRMWGRDPRRMLNGLITNDLARLSPERAVQGLMLTPKGKIISDLRVLRWNEDELLIDLPAAAVLPVTEHLKKYVPPLFARWEVLENVGVIGVYGPSAAQLVAAVVGAAPVAEEGGVAAGKTGEGRVLCVGSDWAGLESGFDLFGNAAALGELWEVLLDEGAAAGARPIGHAALETLRIEAGHPRFGAEFTESVLPAEALGAGEPMERFVSFSKGCYTGQEVVVRIAHRGHPNRHLRGLLLGASSTPAEGAPVFSAEEAKGVGTITSTANSPLMDQEIALAYVRREIPIGAEVCVGEAGGPAAIVVDLPFDR